MYTELGCKSHRYVMRAATFTTHYAFYIQHVIVTLLYECQLQKPRLSK